MQILQKGFDLVSFLHRLKMSQRSVLMLDYDGTLAPFRVERDRATPYAEVSEILRSLMQTQTRVVVITGRTATEVAALLGQDPKPEIWGAHGLERLTADGQCHRVELPEQAAELMEVACEALQQEGLTELAERKSSGVALHWRGLSEEIALEVRAAGLRAWGSLRCAPGIRCNEFDGGLELRVATATKDRPVRAVLAEEVEDVPAAYLGDDMTDEDAFQALRGRGLTVLVRPEPRATRADVWMKPPEELVDFLWGWNRAVRGEQCAS